MKDLLINSIMNNIVKYNKYDESKLNVIKYGLSSLYLHLTKLLVIFTISYFLGLIKTLLLFMLFYSMLRLTGFGMHAKKSSHCWIISLTSFLLIPYLCETLVIKTYIKMVISIVHNKLSTYNRKNKQILSI